MPPAVLKYVDAHRNCEDIAMAFLVANATGKMTTIIGPEPGVFQAPHMISMKDHPSRHAKAAGHQHSDAQPE